MRARLFGPTVARFDGRWWWLMNRPSDGWASFGYRYADLAEIASYWAVAFGFCGYDADGQFVEVHPL